MPEITLSRPDLAGLGTLWRGLEAQGNGSFFQGWNWMGCLAQRRFPDPVLLQAHDRRRLVALALFNRRRGALADTLWLGQSGIPSLDTVFPEHNGILTAPGPDAGLVASCLHAALTAPIPGSRHPRRLVLAGVDAAHLHAAAAQPGMTLHRHVPRLAPFVDLSRLGAGGLAASLSANARHQIRRSNRRYAAGGTLELRRAATEQEALEFLDALAALHQATWTRRGQPGAFASAEFRDFHRALIARALPDGEVDLLSIAAGGQAVGYLYNFRKNGRVLAYQSGFDYRDDPHCKPGLTCHSLAIEMYAAEGATIYDFLAGDDRYKATLANDSAMLHWAELSPWWWPASLPARLRGNPARDTSG
jgi:CelD/BcsL family acetyltransferase involved in cellulose biosynthesis